MTTPRRSAATRYALLGWLLVSAVHYFIISAGGVWPLPSYSAYYNRQAEGFLRGQTSLVLKPTAGLLALPDPYNPTANRPFRRGIGVHDSVLFDGKFYLYWGPVPALLLAAVKTVAGHTIIGDEWLVLGFAAGSSLLVALILRHLWGRYFGDRSPALILLGVALFGLSAPTTYFVARPAVYEAAIISGQFFLLSGLLFSLLVHARARDGRAPSTALLSAAGFSFACAVGCRASLAIAVIVIAFTIVVVLIGLHGMRFAAARGLRSSEAHRETNTSPYGTPAKFPLRSMLRPLLAFSLPLVAGAIGLAAYNQIRFGSPLEFGQKYQLTSANYKATPSLFSVVNTVPSIFSYAARPIGFLPTFPFLLARGGEGTFPDWITLPKYYESNEPIIGLFASAPIFIFAAIPLLRSLRRGTAAGLRLASGLLLAGGGLGFAPVLLMVGSTQRYLMDVWPCCAVLCVIGLWQILEPGRRQVALRSAVALLSTWCIVIGGLFGFSGYYAHFETWNPSLYKSLGGVVTEGDKPAPQTVSDVPSTAAASQGH